MAWMLWGACKGVACACVRGRKGARVETTLTFYVSPSVTQSDFAEFSKALEDCGADLRPLHYLKKWK